MYLVRASTIFTALFTNASFHGTMLPRFMSRRGGGGYIWRGDLTEGFLRYRFEGLYLEGLISGILRYLTVG